MFKNNNTLKTYFPIFHWISNYQSADLKSDLLAGITVAVLLIPQGMAYALIAGLPPIYGLYAALAPQIVYAFLGTSRQLAVGPVAMDSLLVATGLNALSIVNPSQYIQMAILLALIMGAIQFLLGLLKMGFIVAFLSKPVIHGFTSAAAIIIGLSQLNHLLGVDLPQNSKIDVFIASLGQIETLVHLPTLGIGLTSILLLILIKKWNKKIPSALIVVTLGIIWVYITRQDQIGVAVVGQIPKGLPAFTFPALDITVIRELFPIAFTLALIAYMEAISIAKAIQEKHKTYEVNPNQELIALGAANMIGSLFQSYSTTGGFSRTAINDQAGAKTGIASLVSALIIAVILSFFTHWFFYLPKAVLGGIIILAVMRLIDIKYAFRLYKSRKDEFVVLLVTFILTLVIGIKQGILFGIIFSLLLLVYRTSKPHYAFLGRIGKTNYLIILRFDAQLFFGNIQFFKQLVFDAIEKKPHRVKGFIINARAINYIDSTATEQLIEIIKTLQKKNIRVMLVGAIGPARDLIIKSKLIRVLKKSNLFITSGDATDSFDGICKKSALQKKLSRQSNHKKLN